MKYARYVRDHFRETPVFTISELKTALQAMGTTKGYVKLLVQNLLSKGELKRITRGAYTFLDDVEVVGFAFRPFYYGLQEALSLRNLWEQETNPVVITPRNVRTGLRQFEGRNYIVRRIDRKLFFGFELVRYGNFWIPVSDPEKTLIDFIYFKQPLSREARKELTSRINKRKLGDYLDRCPLWLGKRVKRAARL